MTVIIIKLLVCFVEQSRNWSPKQRHRMNSDSESMSGSSSRSHESSPSASPFNQTRKTFLSGSDLTEADRDGEYVCIFVCLSVCPSACLPIF